MVLLQCHGHTAPCVRLHAAWIRPLARPLIPCSICSRWRRGRRGCGGAGHVAAITDNLIAATKAKPMLVVMERGSCAKAGDGDDESRRAPAARPRHRPQRIASPAWRRFPTSSASDLIAMTPTTLRSTPIRYLPKIGFFTQSAAPSARASLAEGVVAGATADHDACGRVVGTERAEEVEPFHVRHVQVEEDDVGPRRRVERMELARRGRAGDGESTLLEHARRSIGRAWRACRHRRVRRRSLTPMATSGYRG